MPPLTALRLLLLLGLFDFLLGALVFSHGNPPLRCDYILMRLALLFAGFCFGAQPPAVVQRVNALVPRFEAMVEQHQLPGAVLYVSQHGEVLLHKAVGYQNIEEKRPMRGDSIFQIMSMTKPITAAALMMLVEEGKVALTDPVEKYLPQFHYQPAPQSQPGTTRHIMQVYHLLTHTNGMTDPPMERRKDIQFEMALPLADAVAYYASQRPFFEPGTRWAYSNEGIATAGYIVEVVSGMPYEKFVEERILKPLGMKDTFFFPDDARIPRIAMLYSAANNTLTNPGPSVLGGDPTKYRKGAKYPAPEYGLYSTAADVAAFYQMMLDGGTWKGKRLLSRSTVDTMTSLHTGNFETFNQGFGNGLAFTVPRDADATLDLLSAESFGHGGAFGTWSFADKAKGLVGVLLVQITGSAFNTPQHIFTAMAEAAVDKAK
jgi:CubicO group peptidase (beta-lactamase class C family)